MRFYENWKVKIANLKLIAIYNLNNEEFPIGNLKTNRSWFKNNLMDDGDDLMWNQSKHKFLVDILDHKKIKKLVKLKFRKFSHMIITSDHTVGHYR